jgi:hypothetical protein
MTARTYIVAPVKVVVSKKSAMIGVGLGTQERRPRAAGALGCRVDARVLENLPDGGGCDLHSQDEGFAADTAVPPGAGVAASF